MLAKISFSSDHHITSTSYQSIQSQLSSSLPTQHYLSTYFSKSKHSTANMKATNNMIKTLAIAALMGASNTAAASIARQTTTTIALGEVQFGTPFCGDAQLQNISTTDCSTALSQLFAANCVNGLCSAPASGPEGDASELTVTVGRCEIIIDLFVGGAASTFDQDSVQNEYATFIPLCVNPDQLVNNGNPVTTSTDGRMRILFSNGINTPGAE